MPAAFALMPTSAKRLTWLHSQRPLNDVPYVTRRRHPQLRPLAGRAPLVVGGRVVVEEVVVVGRRRLLLRLEDEDLAGDLRLRRRMRRVVVEHPRRDAVGRREARRHPVRGDDRHRRAVGDELLDRVRRVVPVRPPVRPVLDDVVVVGDVDVVEIDRAELGHLRDEEVGEALPADAAGVGRSALGLEQVPVERLLRREHERLVDPRLRDLKTWLRPRSAPTGGRASASCRRKRWRLSSGTCVFSS